MIKIPNLKISNLSKNTLKFDNDFINKTKKIDIFYNKKLKKNLFIFSYLFCFMKNFKHNSKIFYFLLMDKLSKKVDKKYKNKYYNDACSQILEQNIRESHLYYEDLYFKKNLKNLLKYMDYYFKKNKIDFSILRIMI